MSLIPSDYFLAFVVENLEDSRESPSCLRRAFNAAVSASHMADHYFSYNARHHPKLVAPWKSTEAFGKHVARKTDGAYADIKSISNAYKHLYEAPKRAGHQWSIASGGSVEAVDFSSAERRLKYLGYDSDDEADHGIVVVFRRRDGSRGKFLPTLERVVSYWQDTLWGPYDGESERSGT